MDSPHVCPKCKKGHGCKEQPCIAAYESFCDDCSHVLQAAIALIEARSIDIVTCEEWGNLAKAVEDESGEQVEWRPDDEIADVEEMAG